jgi:molybdenum cofactor cytidylyltransferase
MVPDRAGPIAGIVLAAGASSRMGTNKLLLVLEGESVVRRAVRRALDAGLAPAVVVLGHDAERVSRELDGLACSPVLNPDPARGMSSSLGTGVAALSADAVAAAVVLADMPLVTAEMIAGLVRRYRAGPEPLVAAEYGGVLAPPVVYDRALFPELLLLEGDGCGRRVLKRHRSEAALVRLPAAALGDLDEPADYGRIRAGLEGGVACARTS